VKQEVVGRLRHIRPAMPAVLALGGVCAVLAGAAAARPNAPSASSVTFRIEHFLCYSIKPQSPFRRRSVLLLDQFKQRRKATVVAPQSLCNWASKNKSPVFDKRRHLLCYTTRSTLAFRTRRVVVTNQFGRTRLAVVKPNALCLPTAKSFKPGTLRPPRLDHYQCYPVRPLTTVKPRRVGVTDEFSTGKYAVTRPVRLCNPVSKNRSRILNARDHLVCYLVDPLQPPKPQRVFVTNQFGQARLVAVAAKELCLPSLKRLLPPPPPPKLPDLTVKIDQASLSVSCPGGGGTCITTFQFTVTNAGAAASGAFAVQATADPPTQSPTPPIPSQASLAAGASRTLTATFGPDGNCFDPDCTVAVIVDSGNAVTESNETNNTDTFTRPG
jgi:CARDB protein